MGSPDEVVINAAWGLGDTVVSGRVTPDVLVLSRPDGRVLQTTVHLKTLQSVLSPNGIRDVPVGDDLRDRASIDAAAASELARVALSTEEHFGCPQDVEWAIDDSRIWILQSRPVARAGGQRTAPADRIGGDITRLDPEDDRWPFS